MANKSKLIAIDFDGTCVTHEYPKVGKDIGAVPVLKAIVESGNQIILWTMRSGKELQDAVEWFRVNEIPLHGINENPTQKSWTQSPKAYAQLYIDDAALGCPLRQDYKDDPDTRFNDVVFDGRPYVDWNKVLKELINNGFIQKQ